MRVTTIISVRLAVEAGGPIRLYAVAEVSTSGWTQASLSPRQYDRPPEDGIADFDFIAVPPGGTDLVAELASPLMAELTLERGHEDYWGEGRVLRGVRVHGTGAPLTALCDDQAVRVRLVHPGSEAWRWPVQAGGDGDLGADLVGMRLRVRRQRDVPVTDFVVDGVLIEVADGDRIIAVRRG